jgi:hypothetical protein
LTTGGVESRVVTTVTVCVTDVSLPALSRASTVTLFGPGTDVSSRPPSGTVPMQDASSDPPSSSQEKSTSSLSPSVTTEPSTGLRRSTVGGVVSSPGVHSAPVRKSE